MAGLSLSLLVVVGLLAWHVLAPSEYVAPAPDRAAHRVDPALATEALHRLEAAVTNDDPAAARALAPAGDEHAGDLLAAVVDNAHDLRVRDFTLRYVDEEGALAADGAWQAAVDTTWRLAGFDATQARTEVLFHFVDEGDRIGLAAIGGGGRQSPLWLGDRLEVRRTASTLVAVDGSAAEADAYAKRAAAAVPVVRRVLPGWHAGLVVEVPRSLDDLARVLAAEPGQYSNIAAVTTTTDGSQAPDAPVHVFVNPDVFDRLKPQGAQVVMSHEAVHVATGAATSATPLWLLEGFADYVALRDVPLPITTTASQIIREVRKDGPPGHLPGPAEFDTTASHLGASYESAWLACTVLAADGGEPALVRFYREVDGGTPLGTALRREFGLTERELTAQWRARLSHLAA
ncbi:hypothetical protein FB382_002268 [Nocardioides ginsengisegetis]|uniref:Peptidase MA superfamily protein n=1 Tax=Nocardioides ginsengisegetis TaxID=661491 RepID=A0A7W3J0G0_9ACTN|nr:hypothetical protein [Nocardioides ginsengisegetis]MBA8803977.1 hypothetical protein [Nocardioides ginsengisegetis]